MLDTDRAQDHGEINAGFERTAAIWSVILGVKVCEHQVALCMAGLKISRATMNPAHNDNYVDLAGYAGIAGALANLDRSNA